MFSLLSSCDIKNGWDLFERTLFRETGRVPFSSAVPVALSRLHLENSTFLDRSVRIKGEVIEVGDFFTYLVLFDGTAKILVLLADVDAHPIFDSHLKTKKIIVWGQVQNGTRGLPYMRAHEIADHG